MWKEIEEKQKNESVETKTKKEEPKALNSRVLVSTLLLSLNVQIHVSVCQIGMSEF